MATTEHDCLPADEMRAFADTVVVLRTRQEYDELLLDALTAPGLRSAQGDRLAAFVTGGRLNRGQEALDRLASWTQEAV